MYSKQSKYINPITYKEMFALDPNEGTITIISPNQISPGQTYTLQVIARDQDGKQSAHPATVTINVLNTPLMNLFPDKEDIDSDELDFDVIKMMHSRAKRAVREDRKFAVQASQTGDLFSVASVPVVATEQYTFLNLSDPAVADLVINPNTGMVSRGPAHSWNGTMVSFFIGITRTNDAACKFTGVFCFGFFLTWKPLHRFLHFWNQTHLNLKIYML